MRFWKRRIATCVAVAFIGTAALWAWQPLLATASAGPAGIGASAIGIQAVVTFPDPNLEAAVRAALGIPSAPITTTDMLALTTLSAEWRGITNLEGLEYATNLSSLDLTGNQVGDLTPISGLTSLTQLQLYGNQITSLSPISG